MNWNPLEVEWIQSVCESVSDRARQNGFALNAVLDFHDSADGDVCEFAATYDGLISMTSPLPAQNKLLLALAIVDHLQEVAQENSTEQWPFCELCGKSLGCVVAEVLEHPGSHYIQWECERGHLEQIGAAVPKTIPIDFGLSDG